MYRGEAFSFETLFKAICEVTLNTSNSRWVQEGQQVMRHLRAFEFQHPNENVFCLYIALQIHKDTYSQFWISVKYEYNGFPQKIVPMTTEEFSILLEALLNLLKQGKRFSHKELYELYSVIINESKKLRSFSEGSTFIQQTIRKWQKKMQKI